ncbi:hypothetical protein TPHA_0I01140 [Tetrapisispora phaffii CBS 4417]|uniref:Amino-acid acetyltransferase, mitochondrial n=1 Tax=Tetrapisispora phaffii (strain ATCC 24235 / CBS 4417 / NBRC 1672 / NRRL Y-8282 / UCD 70-5) TaxID=1071381 RepID=G8BXJ2_TETPH|nr:hypothetical protein TPHA_0I01140 [Tetrapisispora phaffii CBS 4417]CCE64620.1 hypothetical protein TPHA_0I01140 [Tetrapisispora phaffii CBS 4417]
MWKKLLSGARFKLNQPNNSSKKLILSVLNSTATKREARDYLNKYTDDPKKQNYCLLLVRNLSALHPFKVSQLSGTIEKINMLGLKFIFVIPPDSKNIDEDAEVLDAITTLAGLNPLHLQNGLIKMKSGELQSIIESQRSIFTFENIYNNITHSKNSNNLVPIIKPMLYDEKTSTNSLIESSNLFVKHICLNGVLNIDKFFIINDIGGIPSTERNSNSHVFINLSQEYQHLNRDLEKVINLLEATKENKADLIEQLHVLKNGDVIESLIEKYKEHLNDLQLMNSALSYLPNSSTGLITTISASNTSSDKKNPLVYNILTDRSLISSSLPMFKRKLINDTPDYNLIEYDLYPQYRSENVLEDEKSTEDTALVTTVLKRGIDIKIFNYRTLTQYNSKGIPPSFYSTIKENHLIDDLKIDLKKLNKMINRCFGRQLDLENYLKRINGQIATIIVIGDYDGIAILTHEGPDNNKFVYLDKFAIVPEMKGSLGISDIIFNLMFKSFPKELLWRSKKNNAVNKWYFQRSVGVLDLSMDFGNEDKTDRKDSEFKLFYYSEPEMQTEHFSNIERIREYSKYIRDITPSWGKRM